MEYKMGMRLILFFTAWDIEYLVKWPFYNLQGLREGKIDKFIANEKHIVIRTISKDIAPNTRAAILVSFMKKIKELDPFSVNRLEGEVNFFIGKFFQVLYIPRTCVAKRENFEKRFLRSFFSDFVLSVIEGIYRGF